jgi:CBS domain-containing protein
VVHSDGPRVVVPSVLGGDALTITDLDLIRHGLGGTLGETALDIARDPLATVVPSASLERATAMMATLDVAHLLVRDAESDLPEGVLSSFDIVSVLSGRDPRLTRMIRPGPARPLVSASRLSDTTVGQVMHPRVITCLPDTPLHALAGRMADLHAHCIAVSGVGRCPDGDEHLVWALVSDMDVIHAAHRGRLATPAGDLATTTPIALPRGRHTRARRNSHGEPRRRACGRGRALGPALRRGLDTRRDSDPGCRLRRSAPAPDRVPADVHDRRLRVHVGERVTPGDAGRPRPAAR